MKKREQRIKNIAEVRKDIDTSWVREKLQNHCERFDGMFTIDGLKSEIMNNDVVASMFCKDPGKQNISEKEAIALLGADKLPAGGKNSIRFDDDGNIVHTATGHTKSADCIYNGYYATQKFTDGAGGAQDNQRNDVIDFLKRGSISHKVCAIVDGPYWDTYRPILREEFRDNDNVLITSIDEIVGDIVC